jgi:hypothetical protein
MRMLKPILSRILFLVSLGAWALIVFLMLSVARFNIPNIVDDFCFGWVSKEYGILTGAYYYYMGWSGRYFGNILMHTSPLYFSSDFIYLQFYTYSLIAFGFVTCLYVIKRISPWEWLDYRLWTGAFLFQALALYSVPGLYQWFYWFSGIYYYISFQIALLLMVVYFMDPPSRMRNGLLLVLLFCLMGSSEVSMLMFSGVFWGYQIWIWRFKRAIKSDLYPLIAVWLLGFLLVMLSPGNQVRAVTNVNLVDGVHILLANMKDLMRQFISSPFIWAFLAWVWWGFPLPASERRMSPINLLVITILFIGSMIVSFIPLSFALGEVHIPPRILSLFLLFLVVFVAFLLMHIKRYVPAGQGEGMVIFIIVFIGAGIYFSENLQIVRHELSTGRAEAFAIENRARFEQIRTSKSDSVVIAPLKTKSSLFFTEELSSDPKHLWCKCIANYYGKKAVIRN